MSLDCDLKWRGIFCKDSVQQLEKKKKLKSSVTSSSRKICQFDTKNQFKNHCEKLEVSVSDDTLSCTLRMILQALKY